MFRIFFFILIVAIAELFAKDWVHYVGQNEVRDAVRLENGALWAAFAWGLQERQANKTENTYMPGNNNLEVVDFVRIFALPNNDIIAASKNGILVRKNNNSGNFETISNSLAEKKRNLIQGLGERVENILILPFEGALVFFDYEQKRSVITLTQIGTSSLDIIKKISVKNDSIWVESEDAVWKRIIDWKKIYEDRFLADPNSWKKASNIPSYTEKPRPEYDAGNSGFPLERVRVISVVSGGSVLAWGNDFDFFARMQNGQWGESFKANESNYGDDQKTWPLVTSLAMQPSGYFAVGMWGPGLITYDATNNKIRWYHSTNSGNTCPTKFESKDEDGWTIIQGVSSAPNFSGFIFSYFSDNKYGLGFVRNGEDASCVKSSEASSNTAYAVIARQNDADNWEVYTAWRKSMTSKEGGVDFYLTPQNSFSPELKEKWELPFDSPIDLAFDSKGVLWGVSASKIFYLNKEENEWKEPSYIRGFGGATISSLETDAQNGLWLGTDNGAYSFVQINNSPDSLAAKQYKIKDGLLSEQVNDIAIDTIKGKVYFAHNLGLSVYSTPLVRSALDYMQNNSPKPIAYPNPFRPGLHSSVRIDYISEKSSVYILDSSGKRIRFFKGNDLRGGAVTWDGTNESGKLVAPGLYHYIAADGKNTAKGKIIVER